MGIVSPVIRCLCDGKRSGDWDNHDAGRRPGGDFRASDHCCDISLVHSSPDYEERLTDILAAKCLLCVRSKCPVERKQGTSELDLPQ
jgi:hypothetical protein